VLEARHVKAMRPDDIVELINEYNIRVIQDDQTNGGLLDKTDSSYKSVLFGLLCEISTLTIAQHDSNKCKPIGESSDEYRRAVSDIRDILMEASGGAKMPAAPFSTSPQVAARNSLGSSSADSPHRAPRQGSAESVWEFLLRVFPQEATVSVGHGYIPQAAGNGGPRLLLDSKPNGFPDKVLRPLSGLPLFGPRAANPRGNNPRLLPRAGLPVYIGTGSKPSPDVGESVQVLPQISFDEISAYRGVLQLMLVGAQSNFPVKVSPKIQRAANQMHMDGPLLARMNEILRGSTMREGMQPREIEESTERFLAGIDPKTIAFIMDKLGKPQSVGGLLGNGEGGPYHHSRDELVQNLQWLIKHIPEFGSAAAGGASSSAFPLSITDEQVATANGQITPSGTLKEVKIEPDDGDDDDDDDDDESLSDEEGNENESLSDDEGHEDGISTVVLNKPETSLDDID
jgi:hypothetical protein